MFHTGMNRQRGGFEPPIELRFVDLFMILVTTLMFTTVVLSLVSATGGQGERIEPPHILTQGAPAALQGQPYQLMLSASGGTGNYRWTLTSGALPQGLKLREDGLIYGVPTQTERATVQVKVADQSGRTGEGSFPLETLASQTTSMANLSTLLIAAPISTLSDGTGGEPYNASLSVTGGLPPYSMRVLNGDLPKGLTFSPEGVVTGIPEQTNGYARFTIETSDTAGKVLQQEVRLTILPPPPTLWQRAWPIILQIIFWISMLVIFLFGGPGLLPVITAWLEERRARRARGR